MAELNSNILASINTSAPWDAYKIARQGLIDGRSQGTQQAVNRLTGLASAAQSPDEQNFYTQQLIAKDPQAGKALQDRFKAQTNDDSLKAANAARFVLGAYGNGGTDDASKSAANAKANAAYQVVKPFVQKFAADHGGQAPDAFDEAHLPDIQAVAAMGAAPAGQFEHIGNALVDTRTGIPVYQSPLKPQAPRYLKGGDGRWYLVNPNGVEQFSDISSTTGGSPAFVGVSDAPNAPTGASAHAPSAVAIGGVPAAIPKAPRATGGDLGLGGMSDDAITNAAITFNTTGQLPALGRDVATRTKIMNRAAEIAHAAGVDPGAIPGNRSDFHAASSSLQKLQQQQTVMNTSRQTMEQNANVALNIAGKVNTTGLPFLNGLEMKAKVAMGDPEATAYQTAINTVATEYAKLMSGATGAGGSTEGAMQHARSILNGAHTPQQLAANINVLMTEADNARKATAAQIDTLRAGMNQYGKKPSSPAQTTTPDPHGVNDILAKYGVK